MKAIEAKKAWEEYRARELKTATSLLQSLGFTLDEKQVHIGGERYLMTGARDVGGGGKKLVLTGRRTSDGKRVVIKISSDAAGMKEIEREHASRIILHSLDFAVYTFSSPEEILYTKKDGHLIFITSYIEEERTFIEHELEEQFFIALQAFETQEGVHATTYAHARTIKEAFGMADASQYLAEFEMFRKNAIESDPDNTELSEAFSKASSFLKENETVIERYAGFLTHSDFSPQNLRVHDHTLFLLDYASIYFGNKYESWARFINFMIHHNPALEHMLVDYVRQNRSGEEYLSLRLMRVYKIGFLLQFYTDALGKTEGNLHTLTRLRVGFWTAAMNAVLADAPVSTDIVDAYRSDLEVLRSDEEKARQREILARKQI